jgi:alpha-1,3-glucosyltransferase
LSYSTDFDVHQNWLNVTTSGPLSKWYYDAKSEWTLDYPPFFAFFEYFIASVASAIGVDVRIGSPLFTLFHRSSVIAADILLYFATRY